MKNIFTLLLLTLTITAFSQQPNYVQGEILVQLDKNFIASNLQQEGIAFEILDSKLVSKPLNIYLLKVNTNIESELDIIKKLYDHPKTRTAQLNHTVSLRATTPDDEEYDRQ